MNIAFYVNDLSLTGTPEFVKLTAGELARRRHTVYLLLPESGDLAGEADLPANVRLCSIPRSMTVPQFNRRLRELEVDILDYNGWAPLTHLNYAVIGRTAAVPVVAHYHCMVARLTLRRLLGYGLRPHTLVRMFKDWSRKRYFDGHIVCYQAAYDRARVVFGPMNRHKLYSLPCGIRIPEQQVDDDIMLGPPHIIQVGKLTMQKGPLMTLQALHRLQAEFPAAALTLVGQGELRTEIADYIHTHQVRNVRLVGEVQSVQPWYLQANINCLPSKWEAMPFVLKEAGALAIPSITTGRDGQPEAVLDGHTGFIIPEDNPEALYRAMVRLAGDAALRRQMGQAAREHIRRHFAITDMCDELVKIYKHTIRISPRKRIIKQESALYV